MAVRPTAYTQGTDFSDAQVASGDSGINGADLDAELAAISNHTSDVEGAMNALLHSDSFSAEAPVNGAPVLNQDILIELNGSKVAVGNIAVTVDEQLNASDAAAAAAQAAQLRLRRHKLLLVQAKRMQRLQRARRLRLKRTLLLLRLLLLGLPRLLLVMRRRPRPKRLRRPQAQRTRPRQRPTLHLQPPVPGIVQAQQRQALQVQERMLRKLRPLLEVLRRVIWALMRLLRLSTRMATL